MREPSWSIPGVALHVGDCLDVLKEMPDASVDAVVTDPPYEISFMSRTWDASGVAFNPLVWRECLRVLKPGGHLLAFGAPRSYHRLAVAIEDAGFEIRDSIHWIFGSGFPKGQDIAKSIDRRREDREDVLRVTAWLAAARDAAGWTNAQIDALWGFNGMGGLWTTQGKAAIVPQPDQWDQLRDAIGFDDTEIRPLVAKLNGRKGALGEAWGEREVVGTRNAPERKSDHLYGTFSGDDRVTTPARDEARRWEGWNTSLKPAHEPIVLARKSTGFNSTVANVLEHGTGALNIGACRVEPTGESRPRVGEASQETRYTERGGTDFAPLPGVRGGAPEGRWPSNLVFTHLAREWYSLKGGIPLEVCQAIYAYYGINETLPALREGNSGNAVRAGQAQILQQGLRWGEPSRQAQDGVGSDRLQDVRDNVRGDSSLGAQRTASLLLDGVQIQGAPSGSDGEGPHSCSSQKDGGCRDREVPPGELFPVERRQASQERLHLRHDRRSSAGQPSNGSAHDEGQVHCRASHCGCDDRGTSAADRRSGSPCERREVGQPPRESDCDATCGPLDGASRDRASFQDASRGSREVAHGERRLEVAAELIPPGWLKYFDYLGTLSACVEGYECDAGCSVAELDRQSAGTRAALPARSGSAGKAGAIFNRPQGSDPIDYSDRGGASRFFPVFRYEAKAPASERPRLPDGTAWPTVKPLALMRWLVRLVTPPNGVVLDPFAGTGTTGEAALIEGFRSVLVERDPAAVELIKTRFAKPIAPTLDLFGEETTDA